MRRQSRHTNDPSREQAAVINDAPETGIVQRLAGELLSPGRAAGAPDADCQLLPHLPPSGPYVREVGHLAENRADRDDGIAPLAPNDAARDHEQLAPHKRREVEHDQPQNGQYPAILDFAELLDDGREVFDDL